MACLTAYIIYLCTETHYEKCLKKVSRFVHEQNEQVAEMNIKKNTISGCICFDRLLN